MKNTGQKKGMILVVDDSPEVLTMLNDALDRFGFAVLVAMDGEQALTILENIKPELILLDALMPQMDGFETCRRFKRIPSLLDIPVIFMTGLTDSDSVIKGLNAGGVDYVSKPIKIDELAARIQVHITNSKLTLCARQALDVAGQYTLCVDANGTLLWATPEARHLLERHNADEAWLKQQFPQKIAVLLTQNFNKDKAIVLKIGDNSFEIKYLKKTDENEILLRLFNMERPSEVEVLRTNLALTEREAEVLLWIAHGKTNREIGEIITMSPRTVNKHLEQIFRVLNVENRTAAAVQALKMLQRS
jgi:DNA-binding response OmpR family regulator